MVDDGHDVGHVDLAVAVDIAYDLVERFPINGECLEVAVTGYSRKIGGKGRNGRSAAELFYLAVEDSIDCAFRPNAVDGAGLAEIRRADRTARSHFPDGDLVEAESTGSSCRSDEIWGSAFHLGGGGEVDVVGGGTFHDSHFRAGTETTDDVFFRHVEGQADAVPLSGIQGKRHFGANRLAAEGFDNLQVVIAGGDAIEWGNVVECDADLVHVLAPAAAVGEEERDIVAGESDAGGFLLYDLSSHGDGLTGVGHDRRYGQAQQDE